MTLRIPAKVLLHVWSYDFYDMTLSTGKQRRHMINIHFCPVLFGSSKLRFIESIWLQMPVKEACLMLSLFSFEASSLLGAFLP